MLEVAEALSLVLERARPRPPVRTPTAEAVGLVLAEEIVSDIDSPPHDKSLVDGYALQAADVSQAGVKLTVLEEVTAGVVPKHAVTSGNATRIMTGAPIPDGADSVVMIEHSQLIESQSPSPTVLIKVSNIRPGQNIMRRATSLQKGDVIFSMGREIRPVDVGVLAEIGRSSVLVNPRAQVAVLATGNELVDVDSVPAAGQIRNSNGPLLAALVERAEAAPVSLGIARDDEDDLKRKISRGLEHDILVLSGGVSAGVLDLVPSVLSQLGVAQVFHKVHLKPGKPLWFGTLTDSVGDKLVFGLPGNPVSSLVCFELFVRPAIGKINKGSTHGPLSVKAKLASDHRQRGDRPTYWPSFVSGQDGETTVTPLDWKGSADLKTMADANCLIHFPPGEQIYSVGEVMEVFML